MDGHFSGVIKPFEAIGWCQVQGRVDGSCQSHIISTRQKCILLSHITVVQTSFSSLSSDKNSCFALCI